METMSSVKMERRLVIECAWCRQKQLIPTEWAGRIIKCIHCGREGRAYGYLSAPERVQPSSDPSETDDSLDCRGGLVTAMILITGLWAVVASVVHWIWF